MKNKKYILISIFVASLSSCSTADATKIANEFCACRTIEKNQGSLQGEQCFVDWDKKYGKIKLNETQVKKFNEIVIDCNPQ